MVRWGCIGLDNLHDVLNQTGLLGGYLYAHIIARRLGPNKQALLHISCLPEVSPCCRSCRMPAGNRSARKSRFSYHRIAQRYSRVTLFSALGNESAASGMVFPAVSGCPALSTFCAFESGIARGPARLSVRIEPRLTLSEQSLLWSSSYGAFVILCIVTAVHAMRAGHLQTTPKDSATTHDGYSTVRTRAIWFALACSSTLLLMGRDAPSYPECHLHSFLWILPLSLYLFSFVLCFVFRSLPQKNLSLAVDSCPRVPWHTALRSGQKPVEPEDCDPCYAFGMFVCFMFFTASWRAQATPRLSDLILSDDITGRGTRRHADGHRLTADHLGVL